LVVVCKWGIPKELKGFSRFVPLPRRVEPLLF